VFEKVAGGSDGCKNRNDAFAMTAPALHDDARVRRGMERQLEARRDLLADGARSLGWKLGLGTPAAMEQHGTSAPLVGFLTDRSVRDAHEPIPIAGWSKPTAEPEIAVHLAHDVPPDADRETAARAIGGLGVAVELVDLGGGELEEILAGDIFHRHVVLGPAVAGLDVTTLAAYIAHGDDTQDVDDLLALTPHPADAVAHLAAHLAAFGETARAGQVLITGSIVPAPAVAPGDRFRYRLDPLGELTLTFAA
jgi:2-keto-4-pentenoate hydratase